MEKWLALLDTYPAIGLVTSDKQDEKDFCKKRDLPGSASCWTEGIFTFSKFSLSSSTGFFQLNNYNDEELEGTFQESEL